MVRAFPRLTGVIVFALLFPASISFRAQSSASTRTVAFAELTYGADIHALARDAAGNVWFAGTTCSHSLPATAGALQPAAPAAACNGVFGRMTPGGAVSYLSYLGSPGTAAETHLQAIALDGSGNVYLAGYTYAPDFPTTPGAFDRTCGSDGTCITSKIVGAHPMDVATADGFVMKLAPAADRMIYSTYIGGGDHDTIKSIAVDGQGRVHLAGSTVSSDFPVTAGALQSGWTDGYDPDENRLTDAVYARLSADGSSLEYGTYLGGWGTDAAAAIAVSAAGDAFVSGATTSPNFPTMNAVQPQNASAQYPWYANPDAWLARFGSSGAQFSTYMGGSSGDSATAIATVGDHVYVGGTTCSPDFPGAASASTGCSAFIATAAASTGAVSNTILLNASVNALAVDQSDTLYVAGGTSSTSLSTTNDAYQRSAGGGGDAFLAIFDMTRPGGPFLTYSTYLGGPNGDAALAVIPDAAGGAFYGGVVGSTTAQPGFPSSHAQPEPPAESVPNGNPPYSQSWAAHVAAAQSTESGGADIVLYARDARVVAGNWQFVADTTAAGGTRLWNPDTGVPKISTASPSPSNYFDLTFNAQAGVPYHLWLRMKADGDSYQNDSVFVQFSDSVDGSNNPLWQIGSTSATVVSLEDCGGCGEQGWGWNDNGYATAGQMVRFATTGTHTIRIQQREDGISIDQIILSSATWATVAPGAGRNDTTILPQGSTPPSNQPPTLTLTSPTDGATYTAPATLTVSGTTSDPDGSVARLDIYIDGEIKASGQPSNGQFSASWFQQPAGTYTFTVVAMDDQGATTTKSVTVTVHDSTSSNQPPVVTLTSPANGTTIDQASWPVIQASASDSDGSVAKVDFYDDSTLLWTSTTAPYHLSWETMPEGVHSLTAVATDNNGATTTSAPVSITVASHMAGALPWYWVDGDIGDVGAGGSASYGNGTFTLEGSGADVWGTADALHYADVSLGAVDAAIVARVGSVSGEASWVKAGVMIRASSDPDAAQAFMLVSHAKGVCFQRRVSTGATSTSTCDTTSTAPRWVKLVRVGTVISGYESADGTSWTLVGSDTFTNLRGGLAGLAVSSHVRGTLSTATFDHVSVMDATGPNQAPTVRLTSPSNGTTFTAPATIAIGINALDDTKVAKIDLYANSTLIGTVPGSFEVSDYNFRWSNVAAGSYTLTAVASDGSGASTTSAPVSITVNDGAPPSDQCSSLTLSQTSFYSGGPASKWTITVTAPRDTCTWTASIDQAWLMLNGVTGPTTISGTGSGTVMLRTLDNRTGANRYGTFTIGGVAYRVTQEPY